MRHNKVALDFLAKFIRLNELHVNVLSIFNSLQYCFYLGIETLFLW